MARRPDRDELAIPGLVVRGLAWRSCPAYRSRGDLCGDQRRVDRGEELSCVGGDERAAHRVSARSLRGARGSNAHWRCCANTRDVGGQDLVLDDRGVLCPVCARGDPTHCPRPHRAFVLARAGPHEGHRRARAGRSGARGVVATGGGEACLVASRPSGSLSAAGLLLGAPALPETGLSPARSSQHDASFPEPSVPRVLPSSRRTMTQAYRGELLPATFVGGATGDWIDSVRAVTGDALPLVARVDVRVGALRPAERGSPWVLRGVAGRWRYVERAEQDRLKAKSPLLCRSRSGCSAHALNGRAVDWAESMSGPYAALDLERREFISESVRTMTATTTPPAPNVNGVSPPSALAAAPPAAPTSI
jgi:hypothetical protein